MTIFKRKRKADIPKIAGIPIAELGAEFEWTDERFKIALESHPSPKRLLGKASLDMMLALNLYYDDISGKWKPLDSLGIATVQNQARFYLAAPPVLTLEQWAAMRLDENQRLLTIDEIQKESINGISYVGSLANSALIDIIVETPNKVLLSTVSVYIIGIGTTQWQYEIHGWIGSGTTYIQLFSENIIGSAQRARSFNVPPNRKFKITLWTDTDSSILYYVHVRDSGYGITNATVP